MSDTMYTDKKKTKKPTKPGAKTVVLHKVVKLTIDGSDIWFPNPEYVQALEKRIELLTNEVHDLGQKVRVIDDHMRVMRSRNNRG